MIDFCTAYMSLIPLKCSHKYIYRPFYPNNPHLFEIKSIITKIPKIILGNERYSAISDGVVGEQ